MGVTDKHWRELELPLHASWLFRWHEGEIFIKNEIYDCFLCISNSVFRVFSLKQCEINIGGKP